MVFDEYKFVFYNCYVHSIVHVGSLSWSRQSMLPLIGFWHSRLNACLGSVRWMDIVAWCLKIEVVGSSDLQSLIFEIMLIKVLLQCFLISLFSRRLLSQNIVHSHYLPTISNLSVWFSHHGVDLSLFSFSLSYITIGSRTL